MEALSLLSDTDLLTRLPELVLVEREAMADVIEHLVEVERRRLYLEQACSSLFTYCRDRLGYPEDSATKRARVAKLSLKFPRALQELRNGAIHLTGLFLLSSHLTEENAEALLSEARGKTRCEIELLIAGWFPRPDVASKVQPLGESAAGNGTGTSGPPAAFGPSAQLTCSGAGDASLSRLKPLSAERYRIEFTASAEFRAKLEQARNLSSHSVPSGDLAAVLERALDELIDRELKRRIGSDKPRKRRKLQPGSRHVPLEVAGQVWKRDGAQCSFVDAEGRRCTERRFLTLEHRVPFALGGLPTVENICLFCKAHNAHTAREVFGEDFIAEKRAERDKPAPTPPESPPKPDVFAKAQAALCNMDFRQRDVKRVLAVLRREQPDLEIAPLLRAALGLLTP